MSGIYCIKNKITKRVYVGKSTNIEERWEAHKKKLLAKSHNNYLMQNDCNSYGIESFDDFENNLFVVIEEIK